MTNWLLETRARDLAGRIDDGTLGRARLVEADQAELLLDDAIGHQLGEAASLYDAELGEPEAPRLFPDHADDLLADPDRYQIARLDRLSCQECGLNRELNAAAL